MARMEGIMSLYYSKHREAVTRNDQFCEDRESLQGGEDSLRRLVPGVAGLLWEAVSAADSGEVLLAEELVRDGFGRVMEMAAQGDRSMIPEAWATAGYVAAHAGRLRTSAACYWRASRALRYSGKAAEGQLRTHYLNTLAYLYRKLWETERDERYYKRYLSLSSEERNRRQALFFHLRLAWIHLSRNEVEEAEAHVWRALGLAKDMPETVSADVRKKVVDGSLSEALIKLEEWGRAGAPSRPSRPRRIG